jgi:hypothetical protein
MIVDELYGDDAQNIQLDENEKVIVLHSAYIEKAVKLYAEIEKDPKLKTTFHNLMAWQFTKVNIQTLPVKYRKTFQFFNKVLNKDHCCLMLLFSLNILFSISSITKVQVQLRRGQLFVQMKQTLLCHFQLDAFMFPRILMKIQNEPQQSCSNTFDLK